MGLCLYRRRWPLHHRALTFIIIFINKILLWASWLLVFVSFSEIMRPPPGILSVSGSKGTLSGGLSDCLGESQSSQEIAKYFVHWKIFYFYYFVISQIYLERPANLPREQNTAAVFHSYWCIERTIIVWKSLVFYKQSQYPPNQTYSYIVIFSPAVGDSSSGSWPSPLDWLSD